MGSAIGDIDGVAAVRETLANETTDRTTQARAVRYLLQLLVARAPGRAVEVRVPPFGAVQCGEGPTHTRGTPPNVVEMDPATWIGVATGHLRWSDALTSGRLHATGTRADLSALVPVRIPSDSSDQ